MPAKPGKIKRFFFSYLSQPAGDRPLYRLLYRSRCLKVVEIGLGTGRRALRMIDVARQALDTEQLSFTGIDRFEARTPAHGAGLALKDAYKLLTASGAKVRLLPGDAQSGLACAANILGAQDLIVLSHDMDQVALGKSWFYLPRLLHERTHVFVEDASGPKGRTVLRPVTREEIDARANAAQRRQAA